MPNVVSVAWVDGGRLRGFARCCDGGMARIMVVVMVAAVTRDRKEKRGKGSEMRIFVNGTDHLAGVELCRCGACLLV